MKKIILGLLILFLIPALIFSTESGTVITRDVADLARYSVTNSNNETGAKAGFKAINNAGSTFLWYLECALDGSDVYIISDIGHIYYDVPTGKKHEFSVNSAPVIVIESTGVTTGIWLGTDVGVEYGGTGVSSLTDGGIILGSGTGAVTVMDALADGSIVVGDGSTDPVALAAFSSSTGDVVHEAGGLEADVHAYTGLVAITGESTAEVDSKSELEGHIADVADFAEADGDDWSGDHEWDHAYIMGATPFMFEGATDNDFQTYFAFADPTSPDKTVTFQDKTGTVVVDGSDCWDIEGTNLSISAGTLNARIVEGDVSIVYGEFIYFWDNGATTDDEDGNWKVYVSATGELTWAYYDTNAWVVKEEKSK